MLVYRTAEKYKIPNHKKQFPNKFQITKNKSQSRSFCDFCGRQLCWWENVPVVSWVMQRGESKCCGKKLPTEYPLVEMIAGILILITNYQLLITNYNEVLRTIILIIVVTMLVFSAVFDMKYMILPDFSTIILSLGAIGLIIVSKDDPLPFIWGAIGGAVFLGLLHLITRGRGMGMGDVKLAIFMGLFLGWQKLIVAMYVAFIVGAVYGLWLIYGLKKSKKSQIPFGQFLILGTIVAWQFGQNVIKLLITNY